MEGVHGSPRPATEGQTPAPPIVHRTARGQAPVMSGASKPEFEIEKLRREHNVTQFDCGNRALNTWLHKYAWTNQQADSAKTYVAVAGDRVAGYYALATGSVHKHESPERIARGLANHPIGIVLQARLAVDRDQPGKGRGKALLFDALTRIAEAADIVAVRAVMVHAIDQAARGFYEHFEFDAAVTQGSPEGGQVTSGLDRAARRREVSTSLAPQDTASLKYSSTRPVVQVATPHTKKSVSSVQIG